MDNAPYYLRLVLTTMIWAVVFHVGAFAVRFMSPLSVGAVLLAALLFMGLCGSVLAFTWWNAAVQHLGAARAPLVISGVSIAVATPAALFAAMPARQADRLPD